MPSHRRRTKVRDTKKHAKRNAKKNSDATPEEVPAAVSSPPGEVETIEDSPACAAPLRKKARCMKKKKKVIAPIADRQEPSMGTDTTDEDKPDLQDSDSEVEAELFADTIQDETDGDDEIPIQILHASIHKLHSTQTDRYFINPLYKI